MSLYEIKSDNFLPADVRQWEYIAYCLSQLTFTEKGIKKLIELFKTYEHVLCEDCIMDHFRSIVSKVLWYYVLIFHDFFLRLFLA